MPGKEGIYTENTEDIEITEKRREEKKASEIGGFLF